MDTVILENYLTEKGESIPRFEMSYELFGKPLESSSRVVLVCHALTGNSHVGGQDGWWRGIVRPGGAIDTDRFTVICFNLPGNGYLGDFLEKPDRFTARDAARMQILACQRLGIEKLHAAIGGSLGGGLVWEMAVEFPGYVETIIPVAADWKASDWVLAFNRVQLEIMKHDPKNGMHTARMMAMMFYRSPESFRMKFDRSENVERGMFNVESWLLHHGDSLVKRFDARAYLAMTCLLGSLDITKGRGTFEQVAGKIRSRIVQIVIDSDVFFLPDENFRTEEQLFSLGKDSCLKILSCPHGHDGFLIELDSLNDLLREFFE